MNKVLMHGRISKDIELRTTTTGKNVATFSIAVDRPYSKGEEKKADFFNCQAWGRTAELLNQYFNKGKEILITDARLQNRSYEAKDGTKKYITEIVVNEIEFCGSKSDGAKNTTTEPIAGQPVSDDDIPF